MFRRLLFALVLAALLLPAAAVAEEIASYTIQTAPGSQFVLTNNGGSNETLSVQTVAGSTTTPGAQIQFQFAAGIEPDFGTSNIEATFYLNLTTTGAPTDFGTSFVQESFAGTFGIYDNATGLDLLSGTVTGGNMFGIVGAGSLSLDFSSPPGTVQFASSYLSFAGALTAAVSFNMTDVRPALSIGPGGFLASATAEGGGSFSADPPPVIAPEPATVMLGGGSLLSMALVLRKRRRKLAR